MATKKKANKTNGKKAPALPTPQNMTEVAALQIRMAELLGLMRITQTSLENGINLLKQQAVREASEYQSQILQIAHAIEGYAEENKKELTQEGQTVAVPGGGTFRWYSTPLSVRYNKKKTEEIIERIENLDLKKFLRFTPSIDKEAMLKEPEVARSIEGIKIDRDEKFVIQPPECDERIEHNLSTKKYKIVVKKSESVEDEEE